MKKTKGILVAILAGLTIGASAFSLASCEVLESFLNANSGTNSSEVHKHVYEEEVTEPTCTERGYTTYECDCEDSYKDDYVDALGHDYQTKTIAPTCSSQGYDEKNCTVCNDTQKTNYTEMIDHTWAQDYTYNNSFHWIECEACDEKKSEAEHTMNEDELCSTCGQALLPSEGLVYTLAKDKKSYEVSGYEGTATKIVVGDTHNGLPVTKIKYNAFEYNDNIVSVLIRDNIQQIDYSAFTYCNNLKDITIGKDVTSIESNGFYGCSNLTSVVIPDSVTYIGKQAFAHCRSLKEVTLGNNVTSIASDAFFMCSRLEYNEFWDVKYLGSADNDYYALMSVIDKNAEFYDIHPDTKIIINDVFAECAQLISVELPDGLVGIGDKAFYNCSNLETVEMGDEVIHIGLAAFSGCPNLQYNEYANARYLGSESNPYHALMGVIDQDCSEIEIHPQTKVLADISACSKLRDIVVIPDSVISIETWAFSATQNLQSVVIGKNVKIIYYSAFISKLSKVYYHGTEEEWGKIVIEGSNSALTSATRYYYSETEPTASGNYWHYDENGEVAVW